MWSFVIFILSFVFGAVIGSFLNVVIFRTMSGESIVFPSSHCPKCGHKLGSFDLIPILSYLMLKGRCRYCGERISSQYPIIEAITALLFALIIAKHGFSAKTFVYLIMTAAMLAISVIDIKTQEVPYSILFTAGFAIFLTLFLAGGIMPILNGLIGSLVGFLPLFFLYLTGGMGDGDFQLAALMGFGLGPYGVIRALFAAFVIGGAYGAYLTLKNPENRKKKIAFAPFLAIGTVLTMLYF